ncbi:amidohydrolase family protein [Luteimonas sp. SJ-92]|uniref:Amidohydrolase family protein n=1 Tax=Luteimonas salinisoli TaxID=2752307 RepID=A0A853J6W4_9GAMM|nr:amidohydrolase family protein [Luteimonas salinisoli]NZA24836.1 amidohydrolase family protein [Luteimonas salinisoli]
MHKGLQWMALAGWLALGCAACATTASPGVGRTGDLAATADIYAMSDFSRVRKYDAHVHANTMDTAFLEQARADGFELMSINVDYPDFPALETQHAAALALAAAEPARFHWATTFPMDGFGAPDWADTVAAALARDVAQGARAVKIWKNVGMVERDADGRLIMLDHPGLSPVAERIRALGVALIGHQGEPHNCWLPLEEMTTDNDREYFRNHPEYHMYLHPEEPGYEDQIAARDQFLAAHPRLRFVGAHVGSLEYDVDRLGAFLDRFPHATVDLAARMSQVQYQSVRDRDKVRDFFIRYQDRVLYGTDLTLGPDADPDEFRRQAHAVWRADWRYLATAESQRVETIDADVPGLALPRAVVDKLYYANAARMFAPAPIPPASGAGN